ncbi:MULTISPECIES: PhzF family phenazine biosynthesis protein [Spongiibacter]|uniref:PhzF family phenazine biosynthesis protein n=1 Tax=Spongiibacter TaxID=630749 RepID=UPI000C6908CD|nr:MULTISPECIES: PhzF family phenazine biosynthesis protein [Spongiibacter]MAY39401.1 hypothetical protein [Spongiibacter sp.]MBI57271.1 hypothetical protein [Spongiibacter sp.]MBO6753318.1 PhzF family phenazine biosynthesis isomerase [Spongiibacter sp.]|tara:strand:- start:7603 stop:8385 length:783 start_codon:yes stop_codon:yes gene_type:complete
MKSFIVDAFCSQPFTGNPAAVVLQSRALDDTDMQRIAAEFNLSETAFLQPLDSAGEHWSLRWFTPLAEVNLCGHATLAAAHALWDQCQIDASCLRFDTRSGELQVSRCGELLSMNFPRCPTAEQPLSAWAESLGLPAVAAAVAGEDLLLELKDERAVRAYLPDMAAIAALPCRGLIVTAAGESVDVVSRFFAPSVGINEDPVTGSAHCALADYWSGKLGKSQLSAEQLSSRGGQLWLALQDDRVELRGRAHTVLSGDLHY